MTRTVGLFFPLWVALLGCDGTTTIFLPLPETDGRAAVALVSTGENLRAHALDLEAADNLIRDEWIGGGTNVVELLVYDQPLTALGLQSGRLELSAPEPSRPLPEPARVFVAHETEPEFVQAPRSELSKGLRVERDAALCRVFEVRSFTLTTSVADIRVRRLDENSAIAISNRNDNVYVLREDGFEVLENPAGVIGNGVVPAIGGGFWIGGHAGEIWRAGVTGGRFEATLVTTISTSSHTADFEWLAAGMNEGEDELFLLGRFGRITRFRGGDAFDFPPFSPGSHGGVVWLGPGQAIFGSEDELDMKRVSGDGSSRVPLPGSIEGVTGIADLGELGIYVLNGGSRVYRYERNGSVTRLEDSTIALRMASVAAQGDRILYGGAGGQFAEFVPDLGFCESSALVPGEIRAIIPIASGAIILEVNIRDIDSETRYFVLKPKT